MMPVSFDQSLPMILHRTLDAVMPDYRELFARYNLTEQQWRVLEEGLARQNHLSSLPALNLH